MIFFEVVVCNGVIFEKGVGGWVIKEIKDIVIM